MQESKQKIRRAILKKLQNQSEAQKTKKSNIIKEKLFSLDEFKKAEDIICYISLPSEVDTKKIIKDAIALGKRVFAPVTEGDKLVFSEIKDLDKDLERGPLGILQPKKQSINPFSKKSADLVITPGLAFDRKNNRLGRGKGYFDRFLKELPTATKKIALAFDFQILKSVPVGSNDVPVDIVITN